ncbi:hypothetical protein BAUCODRAFT_125397 [Baudoinia panamericana UAMH 10762]|uniref:Methyltransferase domain-containing protein n=1 Tax=Baudoinia panamericana (strain UAMH 10762) TaxID=717646 RepID=M2MQ17_BAUPA|nr:uncharacterized protein BAUCODRAFT_125397 [Baudoinia panamericana UAMH 10762]EMC93543.1 hypothetical protein BAUCODRAFT_125397 [Baudoinia panamericana UAMH 10762]
MLERANALSPFSRATGILDNGCGPGPVMSHVIDDYGCVIPKECSLTCADFSEGMIRQVMGIKESANADSLWKKVDAKVQNAMNLTEIESDSQSHVTAGMVYFMTPDPMQCLKETRRVLKTNGVLSVSAWEGSQWLELMNLLPKVRPDKKVPTMPEAWTSATGLKGEIMRARFQEVETHQVLVELKFQNRESFADFLCTKLPHMIALTKDMSEDEVIKFKEVMVEEMRRMTSSEPGKLKGVALIGVGKK